MMIKLKLLYSLFWMSFCHVCEVVPILPHSKLKIESQLLAVVFIRILYLSLSLCFSLSCMCKEFGASRCISACLFTEYRYINSAGVQPSSYEFLNFFFVWELKISSLVVCFEYSVKVLEFIFFFESFWKFTLR